MAEHPKYVWMDGQLLPWDQATIHVTLVGTAGVSSVFEGIRAYWNEAAGRLYVFRLDAHLERLQQSIRLMRMRLPYSIGQLKEAALALLRANEHTSDTYLRPLAFVESMLFSASGDQAHLVMNTRAWPSQLKSAKALHACVSSWSRITDNVMPPRVKASSNYLNSRLAAEEAKRNGYDMAILLNPEGKVAEGPGACLMIVRDGKIITPTVTSGILESITRATLIQLCREDLHLEVIEREVDRTELYVASEAWLCGTGAEIEPIVSVDRLPVGPGAPGPITLEIESLYHNIVRGIDPRYSEWRDAVTSGR
jgi:branched-chain amino acid aminotransferase